MLYPFLRRRNFSWAHKLSVMLIPVVILSITKLGAADEISSLE